MAADWRSIPKIDAHVHVVLHQRENTDLTLHVAEQQLRAMDAHNVRQAIVLPINYPDYFPLSPEQRIDWLRANNEIQSQLMKESGGRFIAFADCGVDGGYEVAEDSRAELTRAIRELGLRGIKIHPSNLKVPATDTRLRQWLDGARELGIPVIIHSNPSGNDPMFDESAPHTIYRALYGRDQLFVISHLGGIAFLETIAGSGYVDVSYALLMLAELYGIPFCERLLRRIGIDRILFGTDIPIFTYEDYESVFDAMDLADEDLEKIAFRNAERLLAGLPPIESD